MEYLILGLSNPKPIILVATIIGVVVLEAKNRANTSSPLSLLL